MLRHWTRRECRAESSSHCCRLAAECARAQRTAVRAGRYRDGTRTRVPGDGSGDGMRFVRQRSRPGFEVLVLKVESK